MLIRREQSSDVDGIDAVHAQAFADDDGARPIEVELVHRLRSDRGWVAALSFVADDANDGVIGHVVCTTGSVDEQPVALGLGPLGVLPSRQRDGIGSALMHTVLGAADALGYHAVALLGSVDYYARFGFVPAHRLDIEAPEPEWGDHFQVLPLAAWVPGTTGAFRYSAPFDEF